MLQGYNENILKWMYINPGVTRKPNLSNFARTNLYERSVSLIKNPDIAPRVMQIAIIIFMSLRTFRVNSNATTKPITAITP